MTNQLDVATRPPLALLLGELKRMNDRLTADAGQALPRIEGAAESDAMLARPACPLARAAAPMAWPEHSA